MKKLVLKNIIAILVIFPFTNVSAQYAFQTFDQLLNGTSVTFEEEHPPGLDIFEERDIIIRTSDTQQSSTASATVLLYKKGSSEIYGPYTVAEDIPFVFSIDADEWGVRVVENTTDCKISVWIE